MYETDNSLQRAHIDNIGYIFRIAFYMLCKGNIQITQARICMRVRRGGRYQLPLNQATWRNALKVSGNYHFGDSVTNCGISLE